MFLSRQPPPHISVGPICDNLAQNAASALFSARALTFAWPTQPSHPSANLSRRSSCLSIQDLRWAHDFAELPGPVLFKVHRFSVWIPRLFAWSTQLPAWSCLSAHFKLQLLLLPHSIFAPRLGSLNAQPSNLMRSRLAKRYELVLLRVKWEVDHLVTACIDGPRDPTRSCWLRGRPWALASDASLVLWLRACQCGVLFCQLFRLRARVGSRTLFWTDSKRSDVPVF